MNILRNWRDRMVDRTETTSSTLEWAMTELIRNPTARMKLQTEVREIVQDRQVITDDDLGKMQYLKAVIKETLRLRAPVSLLGRVTREDITVMGDPASWDQPEMFHLERFLNSSLDFKGADFKFAPFWHGRRGCPGIALAIVSVKLVLANLVHKFEWKLPMGAKCEDLDVLEQSGVSLHRKNPLPVDMLAGGTDTTSSTLEWAITELLRNPTVMMNLQIEGDFNLCRILNSPLGEQCQPLSVLMYSRDMTIVKIDVVRKDVAALKIQTDWRWPKFNQNQNRLKRATTPWLPNEPEKAFYR
ncbi:hypothetical protein SASPL_156509 [Salvia splendens]|uniref:Uncharacterized protein n=1 Tax=Salvia splendens TaxID=180675 RepID=A0A8X8YX23_SALSN|nr:hypothetical protein SASPL_156509 [Salvia splendens]